MATNNYSITFKSLRSNTVYTLNIGGGSGTAIALKGGAQPFTTEENDDEDQFTPIRTQSGHIRIVDDGKDANGNTLATDWWKDLAPINDTERPVTLTTGGNIVWQGFMQAQNFGGTLYGNPQEREFPVQCCLSVLAATQVSTTETQLCNFAYLLRYLINSIPMPGNPSTPVFSNIYIQGGTHAQQWLLKRIDWHNFLRDNNDNDVEPQYDLYQILEDMCRFWGWTARTHKKNLYLTCADDTAETYFLTLTPANLDTMAGGSTAGTTSAGYSTTTISGDVFALTDNDDYKQRGAGKATVKADVNEQETIVQFAPASVRKQMEGTPAHWTWVQEQGEDLVGYFETSTIGSFDSAILSGTSHATRGGYCRRQIYSSAETDKPSICDIFLINNTGYSISEWKATPAISIQTKKAMAFGGGSITLKGDVYLGSQNCNYLHLTAIWMRLGIGPNADRTGAKWWYMNDADATGVISRGWSYTPQLFKAGVVGGQIKSTKLFVNYPILTVDGLTFDSVPVTNNDGTPLDVYGFVFVDIFGFTVSQADVESGIVDSFQIGNFSIGFSRDSIDIPTNVNVTRPRYLIEERETTHEYVAENQNQTHEEWNADCIFASDNNMEYGYGLLMNSDGSFMATAPYAAGNEHPEQHLANRVANYWARSRRRIGGDFRADVHTNGNSGPIFSNITPQYKLTINGTTCHPVAISRDWRDDVVRLSLLEMPT